MNSKRKIEINIVEIQTYKILIQINSIIKGKTPKKITNYFLDYFDVICIFDSI